MSSSKNNFHTEDLFNTYLVSHNEHDEIQTDKAYPTEPDSPWSYDAYAPKRASFHTVMGKIKRYLA